MLVAVALLPVQLMPGNQDSAVQYNHMNRHKTCVSFIVNWVVGVKIPYLFVVSKWYKLDNVSLGNFRTVSQSMVGEWVESGE